jgi:hypothetical protein
VLEESSFGRDASGTGFEKTQKDKNKHRIKTELIEGQVKSTADNAKSVHLDSATGQIHQLEKAVNHFG